MPYKFLPDAVIAEYLPVLGRHLSRLRTNLFEVGRQRLSPSGQSGSTTSSGSGYLTLFSHELYVPDSCVGVSGSRLVLNVRVDNDAMDPVNVRLNVSGSLSNVVAAPSLSEEYHNFTLDWDPTPGSIVTVDFQLDPDGNTGTKLVAWDVKPTVGGTWNRLNNYLIARG